LSLHKSEAYKIKQRREKVALLHVQSMTESDIAKELRCDQATVSRDLKALREEVSTQFIYDLARSDLAYYYKYSLDSIEQVRREAWNIYKHTNDETLNTDKLKLAALKLIAECSESRFRMISEGPSIMALRGLEERLANIEQNQQKLEEGKSN
jgi:regulatory ArsR family protein